ncbi:DUF6355 family natural product biosynthesis protein [Amycolatopsis sp. NPDC047767]|uniref:DUF6355 family natural product biosynthesis protein n=1 Tax=Amycolatopsis sp. NPDC047767 TaxID=3156765 RepID=UPI0034531B31
MSKIRTLRRAAAVGATALALGAGLATSATAAELRPIGPNSSATVKDPCGYYDWGMYRHCDGGSGSTVMLDVQDIFRNIYHVCVRPGVTNLQGGIRWRVIDAWWNGGVGCVPGFYGQA